MITICMTAQFRFIGAISPNFEVAIRYCGVLLLLYIVFGGYLISIENLLDNVPWFGWILVSLLRDINTYAANLQKYTLPITYTYEAMMANEFRGLQLACSPGSVIPAGSAYTDVAFQSCAIAGSTPGSLIVTGDSYVSAAFAYSFSHVWRNFGIMILFTIAFIILGAYFNEVIEWSGSGSRALEFKSAAKTKSHSTDVEEKAVDAVASPVISSSSTLENGPSSLPRLETDKSMFTWKDLTFTIPYDGGSRMLLNNISGYCAPGQMTALVGASGAGKTTCKCCSQTLVALLTMTSAEYSGAASARWHSDRGHVTGWSASGS